MFSKYYQSELSYLRELGQEFSEANPSLAGLFAEQGGDPDVDRLLEGFAFLTARIRERIEDAVPEIIDALAEMIVPQYTRTLPACSVVEFLPQQTALRGRHTLPAGTEVGARPVQGTTCLFRTTVALELLPLSLHEFTFDHSVEAHPEIRLGFRSSQSADALLAETKSLRLFLHGPLGLTTTTYLWMLRHLKDVVYVGADGYKMSLGPRAIHPVGVSPEQPMLPWPELAPDGLRVIQEYFTLAQKLMFVDIRGLDRVPSEHATEQFVLKFIFDRPPALPERLDKDNFRLHCVPVVNLFEVSADPIARDRRQHEYLLRAAGTNPLHMEIYQVKGVTGLLANRRGRREYTPFYSYEHVSKAKGDQAFHFTRRARSPIDNGLDTYLTVLTPADVEPDFEEETLSIDLLCTNRTLPAELRAGDISVPTPRSPTIARFRNLTQVTRPVRPPVASELQWRLVAHLALNIRTLANTESLRSLLGLYNFHELADQQLGRQNRLRIESIRDVQARA
ncbi:MAG TPA: type VI secretion system baseplate subunit TssF, partial [Polyangiaceae bacterium]|nr:type VI secretion system baseplate subunit TssF [Polyangiaceae bacterium]